MPASRCGGMWSFLAQGLSDFSPPPPLSTLQPRGITEFLEWRRAPSTPWSFTLQLGHHPGTQVAAPWNSPSSASPLPAENFTSSGQCEGRASSALRHASAPAGL